MTENDAKNELTAQERLFAKFRYCDELNNEEIVEKCKISVKTGDRWFKKPKIQDEIARLGKADLEAAQRVLKRASIKAAKRLEVLADTKTSEPPLAETGRKAACNILEANSLQKPTTEGQGNVNVFNFGGLGKMFEGIDTGAIRRLLDDLRNGDRKKGASPVASRITGTSNNEG